MELSYGLRRCPVHDVYIPQLLPMSPQAERQVSNESGALTTCAGATRCTYTSVDHHLPIVSAPMPASSVPPPLYYPAYRHHLQPDLPPALLVPNIMSTPRFPYARTSLADPSFGHLFSPPVQHITPAVANELATSHSLQTPETVQVFHSKPSYSYSALIAMAISASPKKKATLAEICGYITANFPYYSSYQTNWKKSISNCLTRNDYFKKATTSSSRNNYWVIDPLSKRKSLRQKAEANVIPNNNTSIIELFPSVMKKRQAVRVLLHA